MKHCMNCNIKIGGHFKQCPLCQHELSGEDEDPYFPLALQLKKKSLVYKIQLFVSITALMVCILLDYRVGLHCNVHWSIMTTVCIVISQIIMRRLMNRHTARMYYYIYHISAGVSVILLVMSHFLNFWNFSITYIFPSFFILLIGSMFAFSLADKTEDAMSYLLATIVGVIVVSIFVISRKIEFSLLWEICFLESVGAFIGMLIFRGSKVINEINKRMHM